MNLLHTTAGRAALFTLLYVSEGAPIGFIWWALPTLLRAEGAPLGEITGLTAILVLPWVFKFLWSPLVDSLRSPRWGYRGWIIAAQLGMGLTLLPVVDFDPAGDFALLRTLLIAHALCAATQDVAIDALAINVAGPGERGALNGWMQAGMLVGRSVFGGGALLAAQAFGWRPIFIALIVCIWSSLALLLFVREPPGERGSPAEFGRLLRSAFRSRSTWIGLAFALISGAAFEAAGALAGPFLIERGVPEGTIGLFFAVPVVIVTIAGGLLGGKLSDILGRARSVGIFLAGFVAAVAALGAIERLFGAAVAPAVLLGVLLVMYFSLGLFTAASYALFMDLTDPRLGATQFSTFMAATNGCESWSTWAGGRIAAGAGYPAAFFVMSFVSLLSLPTLQWLTAGADETTDRRTLHDD